MEFILASSNAHKAEEFNALLKGSGINIVPAAEKVDIIEDGHTFAENAFKKAEGYFEKFGTPCVADDSGLVIEAMPKIMGIHSARFAPEFDDYKDKNRELLATMSELKGPERSAYFVCNMCFYLSEDEIFFFEGRVHGEIAYDATGSDGFGYDPVFLPEGKDGKSLAELHEWKMKNSHRSKATSAAVKFFQAHNSSGHKV